MPSSSTAGALVRMEGSVRQSPSSHAIPGDSTALLVEKGQLSSVTSEVALEENITAPVSRGQRLGTLTIKSGEQVLSQVPLVAETAVERLSWGDIFVNLLRRMAMAKSGT